MRTDNRLGSTHGDWDDSKYFNSLILLESIKKYNKTNHSKLLGSLADRPQASFILYFQAIQYAAWNSYFRNWALKIDRTIFEVSLKVWASSEIILFGLINW